MFEQLKESCQEVTITEFFLLASFKELGIMIIINVVTDRFSVQR